jgi:hypothetical protein
MTKLAYVSEMFEKMCTLNTSLQGGYFAVVQLSSKLKSFTTISTVAEIYENGR